MMWLVSGLVLVILALAVCLLWPRHPEPPLDPEAVMKAAVELHRIRRNLDVAYTKSEQRRDAGLLEHRIVELTDERDEP